MRTGWLRDRGLSLTLFGLFAVFLAGQSVAGYLASTQERLEHGEPSEPFSAYVTGGAFLESVFENWESEFLQMGMYVLLTAWMFQRGSAESKDPDQPGKEDEDPRRHRDDPKAPWPVRRGGLWLRIYEYSLPLAFGLLFFASFLLHAYGGARAFSEERLQHGEAPIPMTEYMLTSRFWFESLQNWQSEFLAVLSIVLLSIVLRQRGSPQSKQVHAQHSETGR